MKSAGKCPSFLEVMLLPPFLSFSVLAGIVALAFSPGTLQMPTSSTYIVAGALLSIPLSIVLLSLAYGKKLRFCERVRYDHNGTRLDILVTGSSELGNAEMGDGSKPRRIMNALVPTILPVRYVVISDGLLDLPEEEVREVIRHEEGHVYFQHIPLYFIYAVASLAASLSTIGFFSAKHHVSPLFFALSTPIAALIVNRIFWWFEIEADYYVAKYGDWRSFNEALKRMVRARGLVGRIFDTHRPAGKRGAELHRGMEDFTNLARTLFPLSLMASLTISFGPRSYFTDANSVLLLVTSVSSSAFILLLLYPILLMGRSLGMDFGRIRGATALYLLGTSLPLAFPPTIIPQIPAVVLSIAFSLLASCALFGKKSVVLLIVITAIPVALMFMFSFLRLWAL